MADPTSDPAAEEAAAPPKSRKKLFVIIGVVATLVLVGVGVGTYFMMSGGKDAKAEHAKAEHVEPIYVPLDPPFVVNFESNGLVRFLQVTVQVMTEDPVTAELIKKRDPVIRNGLLMLFSGQTYDKLSSTAGKERLRQAALQAVRKAVVAGDGDGDGDGVKVKDLYFTSFVMQ